MATITPLPLNMNAIAAMQNPVAINQLPSVDRGAIAALQRPVNRRRGILGSMVERDPSQPTASEYVFGLLAGYSPGATRRRVQQQNMETRALGAEAAAAEAQLQNQQEAIALGNGLSLLERIALRTNPERLGAAYSSQQDDMVLAPGSVRTRNGGIVAAAPVVRPFDDRFGFADPVTGAVSYSEPRGPTYNEVTQRNRPVSVSEGGLLFDSEGNLIARGSPSSVNVQSGATTGYVDPDSGRFVPTFTAPDIEGERRAAEERQAEVARYASLGRTTRTVLEDLRRARELVGAATAGPGALLSGIPGTQAANLRAIIDTIESNVAFDRLGRMREESPTGGALGAISERELRLLGATSGSLDQSQSPEQLQRALDRLISQYEQTLAESERVVGSSRQPPQRRLQYNPATGRIE